MKNSITRFLPLFVALLTVQANRLPAAAVVGQLAPDFTLTNITGQTHSLSDYRGKIVVLVWVNPECPFVIKHYESGNIPATQ